MADSTVQIRFVGDSRSATGAVRTLEGSFSSLGRTAKTLLGVAGIAGVGIALKKAGQAAIDFDRGMRNVNSLAKMSERDLASLSKQVLALAGPTAQAPKTLAAGLYDIVSSGFSANDAVKILAVSAKAATAGLTDTATATKAVTAVLNAYQLQASDARKVSDVLFQTVNKGVLTFEELASSIGDVLPFASQLGVPLEEIGGAMATMTLQGLSAAESSTRLKGVLVQLLKPNEDLSAAITDLGFASGEALIKQEGLVGAVKLLDGAAKGNKETIASWMGDIRAIGGFLALSGDQLKVFTANAKSMDDATKGAGATAGAFAEQSKSLAFQWERAKQSLAAAAIPIATLLFPALVKGAQAVADFAGKVSAHMPQIKAGFEGLVGPVKAVIQGVVSGLSELSSAAEQVGRALGLGGLGAGMRDAEGAGRTLGALLVGAVGALVAYKGAAVAARIATTGLTAAVAKSPWGLAAAGIAAVVGYLWSSEAAANNAADAFERASDAVRGYTDATKALRDAKLQIAEADLRERQAADEVTAAQEAYAEAVKKSGRGSDEARAAHMRLEGAVLGHKRAVNDLADAHDRLDEAVAAKSRNWNTFRDSLQGIANDLAGSSFNVDELRRRMDLLVGGLDKTGESLGIKVTPQMKLMAAAMASIVTETGKFPDIVEVETRLKGDADFRKRVLMGLELTGQLDGKTAEALMRMDDAEFAKAMAKARGDMDALDRMKASAKVDADITGSTGKLKKVKADLGAVDRTKPKPKVDADISPLSRAIARAKAELASLRDKTVTVTTYHRTVGNVDQRKASGGFIAGPDTGGADSVLAMLAPGEMVLNRGQQNALGGPARLASMFGFSTAGVPGFAAGGLVQSFAAGGVARIPEGGAASVGPDAAPSGGGGGRGGKRGKGRKTGGGRYKAKAKEVAKIQRQLDRNEEDQEIANREYDRMAREFDISTEEFLTVDGNGNETLNQSAVNQRVNELTEMIAKKNQIIGLVQKEKELLGQLLAALEAAAEAYMAEVRKQQKIVKSETHVIDELKKRIARSDGDDRPGLEAQLSRHEKARDKAKGLVDKFKGKAKDMRAEKPDVRKNYRLIDQDILDLGVDVKELQAEIAGVKSVKPQSGGGGSFGSDSGGGDSGTTSDDSALRAMIEELKRRVGELTLALGIESAQLPVIASFAKGTIHVPQTGLYELHAGEEVVPRGRPRGGDGGSIGDVVIQMNVPDSMAWLMRQVDARVVKGAANVSVVIGRQADIRRREGRV